MRIIYVKTEVKAQQSTATFPEVTSETWEKQKGEKLLYFSYDLLFYYLSMFFVNCHDMLCLGKVTTNNYLPNMNVDCGHTGL